MRFLQRIPFLPNFFACPVECLPNEMQRIFHRGEAYSYGVRLRF
jgi:hypothetical protein